MTMRMKNCTEHIVKIADEGELQKVKFYNRFLPLCQIFHDESSARRLPELLLGITAKAVYDLCRISKDLNFWKQFGGKIPYGRDP